MLSTGKFWSSTQQYGITGQLVYPRPLSVALDRLSSNSVFALDVHAQFYFALFVKSEFRRKKIFSQHPFFILFSVCLVLVILVLQPGIYGSLAHPTPIQNALKRSHLWVPSVDIFPKDLVK